MTKSDDKCDIRTSIQGRDEDQRIVVFEKGNPTT